MRRRRSGSSRCYQTIRNHADPSRTASVPCVEIFELYIVFDLGGNAPEITRRQTDQDRHLSRRGAPVDTTAGAADTRAHTGGVHGTDRKSTRLNSSHGYISYAVFCLKKKKKNK